MSQEATQPAPDTYVPMTEDQQLAYTQQIRRGFIDDAVKQQTLLKGDIKDKALVLQTLNDMDRTALTAKKIKSEEETGEMNAKTALVIAGLLNRTPHSNSRVETPVASRVVELPNTVPAPTLAPGEIETKALPMNYKGFMQEQNKKLGKPIDDDE